MKINRPAVTSIMRMKLFRPALRPTQWVACCISSNKMLWTEFLSFIKRIFHHTVSFHLLFWIIYPEPVTLARNIWFLLEFRKQFSSSENCVVIINYPNPLGKLKITLETSANRVKQSIFRLMQCFNMNIHL